MKNIITIPIFLILIVSLFMYGCSNSNTKTKIEKIKVFPSDVISDINKWSILLGDGSKPKHLNNYEKDNFFYVENDNNTDWVIYKTPNSGITSKNSSNTRTEMGQIEQWIPEEGASLTATLKVKHVSTSGDARVAASYSVVVGQIHSAEGHKNEPLKIFYKKFPGHKKGSLYWNYEINTKGDNSKRWDYSTSIWGYDMSKIGSSANSYPKEPTEGIELNEEFNYEINVYKGIMYLKFASKNHPTKTFTKSLIKSDYIEDKDIPQQIRDLYAVIDRDGKERQKAYSNELQYFKLGAYNQTNGKDPSSNMVWSTGSNVYNGNLKQQYDNGSYAEVWFNKVRIDASKEPE